MKSNYVFILYTILLIASGSCHTNREPADPMQADSTANESEMTVNITREQFQTAAMELGGLKFYQDAEIITCNGYLDVPPENRVRIGTFMGGYVKSLNLMPGDAVSKNQTLMILENIDFLKLQQNYMEAREQLEYLRMVYESQKSLADERISSQRNFFEAKSNYFSMMATVESLFKQLQLLNIDPESLTPGSITASINLRSPIDGYISEVSAVKGMFVNPTEVLCEIVNTSHLHIELKVFEKDLLHISKGQVIEFRIPEASGEMMKGEIILVGKVIGGAERTVSVHGHINHAYKADLAPGMYVEAFIHAEPRQVAGLPIEALVVEEEKPFVFVRKNAGDQEFSFVKTPVIIGKITEEWFELADTNAIQNAGDRILIKGAYYLSQEK